MTGPSPESAANRATGARLDGLALLPYRLPLRRPWRSAKGLLAWRSGWLVRAQSAGVCGFGDCAPLIEAATETPSRAQDVLRHWQGQLPGLSLDAALARLQSTGTLGAPAASYALECALQDLGSRLSGTPFRRWISPCGHRRRADSIAVNAMLGTCTEVTARSLGEAIGSGHGVLKIKVGCAAPGTEVRHLSRLAQGLAPGVGLRLDANGAWDAQTAERVIMDLEGLPVESLEEPLAHPDPTELVRLQALSPFPLALDESLPGLLQGLDADAYPVRRAVVKPAVIGGVGRTLGLAEHLRRLGVEVLLTGVVDSAAGLWATAQVAAAVGSTLAQGLATWDWLAEDLGVPPIPRNGRLDLPEQPGSGFDPAGGLGG